MKNYIKITTFMIVIFSALALYSKGNREFIMVEDRYTNFEDAIIVDAIKMDNDQNEIVYDDSFLNDDKKVIKSKNKVKKIFKSKHRVKNTDHHLNNDKFLTRLLAKDSRWHYIDYKIKANDNIWEIAEKFDVSHRYIIEANDLDNPDKIYVGKVIKIPNKNGIYYKIKRGDMLGRIAFRYRISVKDITRYNKLNPKRLLIGKKIFLPNAKIIKKNYKLKHKTRKTYISRGCSSKLHVKSRLRLNWPLRGRITSAFGYRKNPFQLHKRQFHCGVDISVVSGTPVRAALGGRVIFSGAKGGYGLVVILRHHNGYITVYGHNSKILVKTGEIVKNRQMIAKSGATGLVTGAHLHFEVRKYRTPLNPMRFLK